MEIQCPLNVKNIYSVFGNHQARHTKSHTQTSSSLSPAHKHNHHPTPPPPPDATTTGLHHHKNQHTIEIHHPPFLLRRRNCHEPRPPNGFFHVLRCYLAGKSRRRGRRCRRILLMPPPEFVAIAGAEYHQPTTMHDFEGGGWKVVASFEGNFPNRIKQLPLDKHFDLNNVKRLSLSSFISLKYFHHYMMIGQFLSGCA
ncbi:dynamin-2B [Artemisia annua]|uniref:Dynamin-2B n=1 Tax=Artemisia annua TaxID=35608 RepID=A0A2U1LSR5_ARTAN|nr:dynamin-2B [Artemisia annua]